MAENIQTTQIFSENDHHTRFMFADGVSVRGDLVTLQDTWTTLLARHPYPEVIKKELAQAFVATVLLSSTLKFEGGLTLQIQGDEALNLIVVQVTEDKQVRGLARWEGDVPEGNIKDKMGDARLVITIHNPDQERPYQAIVPMEGTNLSEILEHYFKTSVQLPTRIWLAADAGSDNKLSGMLLQRLPDESNDKEKHDEDWNRLQMLTDTVKDEELLDLDTPELLYRLYHEESVRIMGSQPVVFNCSCSEDRIINAISSLGQAEVHSIIEEMGAVEVRCEFCNKAYHFSQADTDKLFETVSVDENRTVH